MCFVVIAHLLYGHLWVLITEFLKGHFLYVYQARKTGVESSCPLWVHVLLLKVLPLKCYLVRTVVF